jgi:phosphoglycolate phosphatase-like HAD superfamily hydrolase
MTNLIFINLYGTILPVEGEIVLRDGFLEFLKRYKSMRFAILTYKPKDVAIPDLIRVGLLDKVEQIYTLENMRRVRMGNRDRSGYKDGYPQPDLRGWARADFRMNEDRAVVISDNPLDIIATDWYGVKLLEIPVFKNKYDTFSFDDVSVGSWYYDIRYFVHKLKGKQMKISLKTKT